MVASTLWKEPRQRRSQRRFDAMLEAALEEIGEVGVEGMNLTRIAERAEVPIGSLYQFFQGREGLLACLMNRSFRQVDALFEGRYRDVADLDAFVDASEGLVESFYRAFVADPRRAEIRISSQTSEVLRQLDQDASRHHAQLLFEALRPLVPQTVSDARIHTACFMLCDLLGAAALTASQLPAAEGLAMVEEFDRMAVAYVRALARGSGS